MRGELPAEAANGRAGVQRGRGAVHCCCQGAEEVSVTAIATVTVMLTTPVTVVVVVAVGQLSLPHVAASPAPLLSVQH